MADVVSRVPKNSDAWKKVRAMGLDPDQGHALIYHGEIYITAEGYIFHAGKKGVQMIDAQLILDLCYPDDEYWTLRAHVVTKEGRHFYAQASADKDSVTSSVYNPEKHKNKVLETAETHAVRRALAKAYPELGVDPELLEIEVSMLTDGQQDTVSDIQLPVSAGTGTPAQPTGVVTEPGAPGASANNDGTVSTGRKRPRKPKNKTSDSDKEKRVALSSEFNNAALRLIREGGVSAELIHETLKTKYDVLCSFTDGGFVLDDLPLTALEEALGKLKAKVDALPTASVSGQAATPPTAPTEPLQTAPQQPGLALATEQKTTTGPRATLEAELVTLASDLDPIKVVKTINTTFNTAVEHKDGKYLLAPLTDGQLNEFVQKLREHKAKQPESTQPTNPVTLTSGPQTSEKALERKKWVIAHFTDKITKDVCEQLTIKVTGTAGTAKPGKPIGELTDEEWARLQQEIEALHKASATVSD